MMRDVGRFLRLLPLSVLILQPPRSLAEDVPAYATASWSVEGLGNHRARLKVEEKTDRAFAHVPWRRRDERPEAKALIVIDAATGERVKDVFRVRVDRDVGDLIIRAPTAPGEYFLYYLPFVTEGWWAFPMTKYLAHDEAAEPGWRAACEPAAQRIRAGADPGIPRAGVIALEAVTDFHRFDPMEVVATAGEVKALLERHAARPYLLFPEDRRHPIRMTDDLPLAWVCGEPGGSPPGDSAGPASFHGEACRGEFYALQIGVWAARQALEDVHVETSDLRSGSDGVIPAAAVRCLQLGGTDWLGRKFVKPLNVPAGKVQALWLGVDVPAYARPGAYTGTVTIRPRNSPETPVRIDLRVTDKILEDRGDSEIWRHSRLRWLDSTIGLDDEPFAPYGPVEVSGRRVRVLGREVRFGESGLLESASSTFSRSVDRADAPPTEILAETMRLVVVAGGAPVAWAQSEARITRREAGAVSWESSSRSASGSEALSVSAKLECDGYIGFDLRLSFRDAKELDDVRLEIPLRRSVARYFMGLGCKGGCRPARWEWAWDPGRANSHLWIGDVHAGLHMKLKHVEDRWDLYSLRETGPYRDWMNGGKGGCTVTEVRMTAGSTTGDSMTGESMTEGPAPKHHPAEAAGDGTVLIRAYTGPRIVAAGEELRFRFGILVTPLKALDRGHWRWRYFHGDAAAPVDTIAESGATLVNLHHGNPLNPHINYPFLTADRLAAYASQAHSKGLKVKIYYTVRELSNYTTELWALRSLGSEVFLDGPGFRIADQFLEDKARQSAPRTGDSWLCEHVITRYVSAWHQPLSNGKCDAALATTGLSRWHNYYLEGLAWLVRNAGIDGLYLDGIGYDREIMKRVRKVLQRSRPGCLIDFHSGNNFHPDYGLNNCASQYLEHFSSIDSLWFGEGFDYNEPPDYWLVEISGIPFGLFGEMLQGGGNPWRGMLYGMTSRLGWGGDPRGLWKLWDDFGIDRARMIGYWDPACPVRVADSEGAAGSERAATPQGALERKAAVSPPSPVAGGVLATVYAREKRALIALASWSAEPVRQRLEIDFDALGLRREKCQLYAPPIAGLQPEALLDAGEPVPVAPGRGWLLVLDEEPRALSAQPHPLSGLKPVLREPFEGQALPKEWRAEVSAKAGVRVAVAEGALAIEAPANAAAFVERELSAGAEGVVSDGVGAVSCVLDEGTDRGASWGPGVAIVWNSGRALRVNVRAEGRFGVDDGSRQILEGVTWPGSSHTLVIRLDPKEVVVQASADGKVWQRLASFPRAEFPGNPRAVRVGKMSPGSRNEDFSDPGPQGSCAVRELTVFGSAMQ